jgi:hypothetical protein
MVSKKAKAIYDVEAIVEVTKNLIHGSRARKPIISVQLSPSLVITSVAFSVHPLSSKTFETACPFY